VGNQELFYKLFAKLLKGMGGPSLRMKERRQKKNNEIMANNY
jgi:hypothetical protein